jgi:hypothetical protein
MRASQVYPQQLRDAVTEAVTGGAWSPMAVIAAVACDFPADRASVLATLWDLRDEGVLVYDASGQFPGFRPVS